MRGYCGIGIYQPVHDVNIGTLWRSAYILGADYIFTVGRKYKKQSSDTCNATQHLPYFFYQDYEDFISHLPKQSRLVCVEMAENSFSLKNFVHPEQAVYLLGNEVYGIHQKYLQKNITVAIPSSQPISLNVSTVGSIILYDRMSKGGWK